MKFIESTQHHTLTPTYIWCSLVASKCHRFEHCDLRSHFTYLMSEIKIKGFDLSRLAFPIQLEYSIVLVVYTQSEITLVLGESWTRVYMKGYEMIGKR